MKIIITFASALACLLFIITSIHSQTTIITNDPAYTTGESSAILDVKSTDKGFLPPRMTEAQRDAISSPALGLTIFNTDDVCLNIFVGYGWRNLCAVLAEGDVMNPTTGKIWMDRNLGATQVATSSTDADAYGNLFQWGRFDEGHQVRTSAIHNTGLASTSAPNAGNAWDGKFITSASSPYDWLSPQDANLWQGVNGTNNPCPDGYRLPTEAEWNTERGSWSSNNAAGAFASPLKLPLAGTRTNNNGSLILVGTSGFYWSSTVSGTYARYLYFDSSNALINGYGRAYGHSVRCLKD